MLTNTYIRLSLFVTFSIAVLLWYVSLQLNWETMRKIVHKIKETDQANRKEQNLLSNFTAMSKLIGADRLPFTLYRSYSLENPSLCSSVSSLLMLVAVKSSPRNFDNRKILRETWMNQIDMFIFGRAKFVFVLGKTDSSTQKQIEDEFSRYGDILQGEFIDSYRNLTEKGITLTKWASERCRNAKMIMQTDDDVVVNVFNLFKYIVPFIQKQSKTIICSLVLSGIVQRRENNKWFIESNLFPDSEFYPPFCQGFFVLYTNDLTPLLYEAAKSTPFFWVDDVYLYGLLVKRIPGVDVAKMKRNTLVLGNIKSRSYDGKRQFKTCDYLIAAGNLKVGNLRNTWNEIVRINLQEIHANIIP